jgi:acetyltransferase-like isoleucine patch superfamily enzyme
MVIIGLGGLTKDILNDLLRQFSASELLFFSEIANDTNIEFFKLKKLPIAISLEEVLNHFEKKDKRFLVTLGNNNMRCELVKKYIGLGGVPGYLFSDTANISLQFSEISRVNTIIMHSAMVSAGAIIGPGSIVSQYAYLGHDVVMGEYSFLGGYSCISNGSIGDFAFIGLKTVILPGRNVGKNSIIGAMSLVNKSVGDHKKAYGIPAKEQSR